VIIFIYSHIQILELFSSKSSFYLCQQTSFVIKLVVRSFVDKNKYLGNDIFTFLVNFGFLFVLFKK